MTRPQGLVSQALEAELRDEVRRNGIVVWLDLDGSYTEFVDQWLADHETRSPGYPLFAFRGSFLELMRALAPHTGGVDLPRLMIHLPGFDEARVKDSPIYELYCAGKRFRKKLSTLVTDAAATHLPPDQIAAFVAESDLTLSKADAWLAAVISGDSSPLASELRQIPLPELVDGLLDPQSRHRRELVSVADWKAIEDRLLSLTGMSEPWLREVLPSESSRRQDNLAFAVSAWAMCVEYVNDLDRAPIGKLLRGMKDLPKLVVEECRLLLGILRQCKADFYRRTAREIEDRLADEIAVTHAEELGTVETFAFEEVVALTGALQALAENRWQVAADWATRREADASLWLKDDLPRRNAWHLVGDAARLGMAIEAAGPGLRGVVSLEGAVEAYTGRGAAVDRAHRQLEQRRQALLHPQVPHFELLRSRLDLLRELWRQWADGWAREFNALCRQHGFIPSASLQQRTLFDDVVRPLTQQPGITVLFLVDALRYEMATELHATWKDASATTEHLNARLAELPTVTEVGMNVLATKPKAGRLEAAVQEGRIAGFSGGEFRVSDPDSRRRSMHGRVGGSTCPWLTLNEVLSDDKTRLKQKIARARLVIVESKEIDNAGEKGAGPAVFEQVLQQLRSAWRLLRDVGVQRFVFTSDHGFLLLSGVGTTLQSHGRKIDPKRRHVISPIGADHAGEVRVPLRDLGYDCEDLHLMMPATTAPFDTGDRPRDFVHGGNSLQERVIPVLTLVHRAEVGGTVQAFDLEGRALPAVAGMHCIEAMLKARGQKGLKFGGTPQVALGLRVVDDVEAEVKLCEARRGAKLEAGAIVATVAESFEVFFRLSGPADARVRVELFHGGGEVDLTPLAIEERFDITDVQRSQSTALATSPIIAPKNWLADLPEGGVRKIFEHLASHGAVTEVEAVAMLGNQRALRRFALQFESFAARAPFQVSIENVAGEKRYVRTSGT